MHDFGNDVAFRFRPLAVRNVLDASFVVKRLSFSIGDDSRILRNPDLAAILTINFVLEAGNDALGFQLFSKCIAHRWIDISLALDVLARGDQFLRRLEAEHLGQRWISGNKAAVRRVLENALDRVLEDAAIFPFRFFERSFRSFPSARSRIQKKHSKSENCKTDEYSKRQHQKYLSRSLVGLGLAFA